MCIFSHQVSFSSLPLFLEQELAYTSLILLDMVGASSLQGVCVACVICLCIWKKISLLPLAKICIKLVADEKGGTERQFPQCVPTGG